MSFHQSPALQLLIQKYDSNKNLSGNRSSSSRRKIDYSDKTDNDNFDRVGFGSNEREEKTITLGRSWTEESIRGSEVNFDWLERESEIVKSDSREIKRDSSKRSSTSPRRKILKFSFPPFNAIYYKTVRVLNSLSSL